MEEQKPTVVHTVNSLEEAERVALEEILARLEARFSTKGITPKQYHNSEHSKNIQRKTLEVFDALRFVAPYFLLDKKVDVDNNASYSEDIDRLRVYASIISLGHDLVQQGEVDAHGKLKANRGIEEAQNEGATALEIYSIVDSIKDPGKSRFMFETTLDQIRRDLFATAIKVSIESIEYESSVIYTALKIYQPLLFNAGPIGFILAMADLKGIITSDNETQVKWSNASFRESDPWLYTVRQKGPGSMENTAKLTAIFSIRDHIKGELGFLAHQKQLLLSELAGLRSNLERKFDKESAAHVFHIFEREFNQKNLEFNIRQAVKRAKKVDDMCAKLEKFSEDGDFLNSLLSQLLTEVGV